MMRPKRILTQADFQRSQLLYRGKIQNSFDFKGRNIFELQNGEFFIRQDIHLLAPVGFFPVVEIFRIDGELVLAYFEKWQYTLDRKSTRLNSSHVAISYAVFCLK